MGAKADKIKEYISIEAAAERYGLEPNRRGYLLCPLHGEDTPSLKLYPETNSFYCFGCGAGGDVIELVRRLCNLSYSEAVVRLASDFGLVLEDSPLNARRAAEIRRERARAADSRIQARTEYMRKIGLFAALWDIRKACAPAAPEEEPHPCFVQALHELDYLDYWFSEHPWK